jgi:hypothetical protein
MTDVTGLEHSWESLITHTANASFQQQDPFRSPDLANWQRHKSSFATSAGHGLRIFMSFAFFFLSLPAAPFGSTQGLALASQDPSARATPPALFGFLVISYTGSWVLFCQRLASDLEPSTYGLPHSWDYR